MLSDDMISVKDHGGNVRAGMRPGARDHSLSNDTPDL